LRSSGRTNLWSSSVRWTASPEYKLFDINPLAPAPGDLFDHGSVVASDALFAGSVEATDHVLEQARAGLARAKRMGEDRAWKRVYDGLRVELEALAAMSPLDRRRALRRVLVPRKQHALNLLVVVVEGLAKSFSDAGAPEPLVGMIRAFGSAAPGDITASALANACAEMVLAHISDRICLLMADGPLDEATLRDLLEGAEGAGWRFRSFARASCSYPSTQLLAPSVTGVPLGLLGDRCERPSPYRRRSSGPPESRSRARNRPRAGPPELDESFSLRAVASRMGTTRGRPTETRS
jgi:hypothetical protein